MRRLAAALLAVLDVTFGLRLPVGADDRLGFRSGVSWLGSGLPLLAWERGRGWASEPETAPPDGQCWPPVPACRTSPAPPSSAPAPSAT